MQIKISWLLKKPTDLDLHCLQRQGISGISRTRVKKMHKLLYTVQFNSLHYGLYSSTAFIMYCTVQQPSSCTVQFNSLLYVLYSLAAFIMYCTVQQPSSCTVQFNNLHYVLYSSTAIIMYSYTKVSLTIQRFL